MAIPYWYHTGTALYIYWYCEYCWYIGTCHSMSLYQYVTGTVGTLVPVTLCLCTNMLLVLHWYCSLYVLVLWVLLGHWYQSLYVSVPICYWYCTGTALYMYWYCGYCWYIGTSHSMSLYRYVTGNALVLLFICTGTVGTVGILVTATLHLCTNMLLVLHWYCSLYVLVLWVLLVPWYQPLYVSPCLYVTGAAFYMYWYCGYCWYNCTSHSVSLCAYMLLALHWYCFLYILLLWVLLVHLYQPLCLFTNMLLVLHWYCSLYILVLLVLLVHWFQLLYVSVQICYWHCTGTALYMYWYCCYFWCIGISHSTSLYQYVAGTALVLLFICTGTVGTVGTLVLATLCLFVPICYWYCSLSVLVLLVQLYHPLYVSAPICYWYCTGTALYMYWYCEYCWYIGTSHSKSLCLYVTGTTLVLLLICTCTVGTVGTLVPATLCLCTNMLLVLHWCCSLYVLVLWVLLVHWYQPLYVSLCLYVTGTALYLYWYCWYSCTSHSMSLHQYVTGTALVLLFICTGTVGTVGTLVLATLCLCTNMLLVLYWYCSLYVLVLWVLLVHWYQPLYVSLCLYVTGTALYLYWYSWYSCTSHSMSLHQYVTGTALVLLFICTGTVGTVGTLVPAALCLCTNMLLVLYWYCSLYVLVLWVLLVPVTLCLCTYMLLVPHWYCSLYVLVLWVLLVDWY